MSFSDWTKKKKEEDENKSTSSIGVKSVVGQNDRSSVRTSNVSNVLSNKERDRQKVAQTVLMPKKEEKKAGSFADWTKERTQNSVNEDYLRSFENDVSRFYENASNDFNASPFGVDYNQKLNDYTKQGGELQAKASAISQYLNNNRDNISDDTYKSLMDYIKSVNTEVGNVVGGVRQNRDFYGQFASEDDYKQYLTDIENSKYQNKRFKETDTLTAKALSADDFEEYSSIGASYVNPSRKEAEGKFGIGQWKFGQKPVQNIVTYSRENAQADRADNMQHFPTVGNPMYSLMDDNEVNAYNYYLAKENAGLIEKGTAESYLESLTDKLNAREGQRIIDTAKLEERSIAMQYAFGLAAGITQFTEGIAKLVNFSDDKIPTSPMTYASQMLSDSLRDEDGGWTLRSVGYDLSTTIGNQLPNIAASAFVSAIASPTVGSIVGTSLMGASAAGNEYAELLNSGMSKGKARTLSTILGAWEGASEYYLGAIEGLARKPLSDVALANMKKGSKTAVLSFGMDMLEEGSEEVIQDIGSSIINGLFTGDYDFSSAPELAYSFTLGALSACVLNGVRAGSGRAIDLYNAYGIKKSGIENINALKNVGSTFAADTVAYKLAGQIDENTGAWTLSRMLHDINANLTEQNQASIAWELQRNGMAESDAKTISEWLGKAVSGENFTKAQRKVLENNPIVSRVYKKVIVDANSTVNQRLSNYEKSFGKDGQYGVDFKALAKASSAGNISNSVNANYRTESELGIDYDTLTSEKRKDRKIVADAFQKSTVGKSMLNDRMLNTAEGRSTDAFLNEKVANAIEDTVRASKSMSSIEMAETLKNAQKNVEDSVSDSDATILKSTGEDVNIKKIDSIQNGKMVLELDNGQKVDSSDISYDTLGNAIVYETIAKAGYSVDDANAIVQMFKANDVPANKFMLGVNEAYKYGMITDNESIIPNNGLAADLPASVRSEAFKLGRQRSMKNIQSKQKSVDARKKSGTVKKAGKVVYAKSAKGAELSERQNASVKTIDKVVSMLDSVNVVFYASKDGKLQDDIAGRKIGDKAQHGAYTKDGTIYIDINAGVNYEGVMLYTFSHELLHHLANTNPTQYKALADFIMNEYGKAGVSIDSLIKEKMHTFELSFEDAFEEVIADTMQPMFTDADLASKIAKLKEKDAGLFEQLKQFFVDLYNKIKELYKGTDPYTREGQLIKRMSDSMEKISDMFAEGLVNSNNVSSESETVNDGIKFSDREVSDFAKGAEDYYGTTDNWELGGYLTVNGKMLDFSDGQRQRVVDHREITDYYDDRGIELSNDVNEGMVRFMNDGNIRFQSYSGFELAKLPTKKQFDKLADIIDDYFYGNVSIDYSDETGRYLGTSDYEEDTSSTRIISDIKKHFEDGSIPKGTAKFSDRDVEALESQKRFAQDIDTWNRDGRLDNVKFILGSTGDVIQGLGAIESDIYMLSDKINTILETHSEMSLDEIKKIPRILESPVLILKSKNKIKNNTRIVVFGTIKSEKGNPIIAILDLRPSEKNLVIDGMQKVTSSYAKSTNPAEFVSDSEVLYLEKNKAISLLRTIGFQSPIELNETGFIGRISYQDQYVNINGKLFSDVVKSKFSDRDASYTEERIDRIIREYGASNPDYAQAYVATISPRDFLKLTIRDEVLEKWNNAEGNNSEIYALDRERLAENTQTPFLSIEDGEVIGHEGRHRMRAMMNAGIERVPVIIRETSTKYSKKKMPEMTLTSQDFGRGNVNSGYRATITNLIPTNKVYRDDIISSYGKDSELKFSDRDRYDAKAGYVERRNAENALVESLSEEQHSALADVARLRHELHSNWDSLWNAESASFQRLWDYLPHYGEEGLINETLSEAGLPSIIFPNLNDVPSSMDYDFQDDYDNLAEWTENSGDYERFAKTLSNVNEAIENYLRTVDKEHGTKYAPSGFSRFYSDRDESLLAQQREVNKQLEEENEILRKDNEDLKQLVEIQKKVTGGTIITKSSIESIAGTIMNQSDVHTKGNKQEFVKLLEDSYNYILRSENIDFNEFKAKADKAVEWLMENKSRNYELSEDAEDLFSYLKGKTIYISPEQRSEINSQYGNFNDFRSALMGRVNFTFDKSKGIAIDSLFSEAADMYPNLFDAEISDVEMPSRLRDIVTEMKESSKRQLDREYAYYRKMDEQEAFERIYDGYWKISTLKTVADRYQKQINRLKGKHIEQMQNLREKHKAKDEALRKKYMQEKQDALNSYREKAQAQQKQIVEKYRESRQNAIIGRNKTALRHQIKGVVKELNQYLLSGTKEKHIMIGMQKAVAEALNAVNFDTVDAQSRIEKYDKLIAEATNPEVKKSLIETRNRIEQMGDKMDDKLTKLKNAYDEIINSNDPMIANSYDDVIASKIQETIEIVGNTSLRSMELEQLSAVYDMYKMVLTSVRNANKLFKDGKKYEVAVLGNRTIAELDQLKKRDKLTSQTKDLMEKFEWNNLKPVYAFKQIGSNTLLDLFDTVRGGEDVWARDVSEARDFFVRTAEKYNAKNWDKKKTYEFQSTSGKKFNLNLQQIMSLYAFSKREQARDHIRRGGIVIDERTVTKKGLKNYISTDATAYNISDATLDDIIGSLTEEQRKYVDDMQEYLSTTLGSKGNEVSLELYGVKLFGEKFYFPLRSAQQYMPKAKEQAQGEGKIKNAGFSKTTKAHASNPIILSEFDTVWASHADEMSRYHAFVLPLEDFYKVYNYRTPVDEKLASDAVNAYIENTSGKGATQYIEQLLRDLNGGTRTDNTAGVINKFLSLFKKGAVMGSASVVIQQPSAVARVLPYIELKYFIGEKVTKGKAWEEAKQYAPVAIIKEMGGYDTHTGQSTLDYITDNSSAGVLSKFDDMLGKAPEMADQITWCAIWQAAKRKAKATTDLTGEALLRKAGEIFTEAIVNTQVYDSVLSRSGNMRSKDGLMKMATAFMAEPTTSINMVSDAINDLKKGNRKQAVSKVAGVVSSVILNSLLVGLVYAARDDDDDETYWEKYISSTLSNILEGVNPATYIPFVKDVYSEVQGYTTKRTDISVLSDLIKAIKNFDKAITSDAKDAKAIRTASVDLANQTAMLFGIPTKNLTRDYRAIVNTWGMATGGVPSTKTGTKLAIREGITEGSVIANRILGSVSKGQQMYMAVNSEDYAHNERVRSTYKSESSADTAYNNFVMDMFEKGKISREKAIDYMVKNGGKSIEDAEKKVGAKEFEQDYGVKFEDRKDAYRSGTITRQQLIDALVTQGKSTKEAELQAEIYDWEFEGMGEVNTETEINDYYDFCQPAKIDKQTYCNALTFYKNSGNGERNSKVIETIPYIDSLPLTDYQKNQIALCWWKQSTIDQYADWN